MKWEIGFRERLNILFTSRESIIEVRCTNKMVCLMIYRKKDHKIILIGDKKWKQLTKNSLSMRTIKK